MSQRYVAPAVGPPIATTPDAVPLPATEGEFLDELASYDSMPPRQSCSVRVQVRPGERLRPLSYPTDDGDA